jgi:hypothetical protein
MAKKRTQQPTKKAAAKKKPEKPTKKANQIPAHKPATGKHPGGRPSVYRAELCNQAFQHCLLGATDNDLSRLFNISVSTLNKWKLDHPEFSECIKRGKEDADARVAGALYSRAIGFTKDGCEKVFQHKGEIIRATVKEYYPPDVGAGEFWLKKRHPSKWGDRQTVTLENPDGTGLFNGFGFVPYTPPQSKSYSHEERGIEEH